MQPNPYPAGAEQMPSLPLYSSLAIKLFSFFFGPIFGGVLAYHNLRDLGRPDQARKLLGACLLFTAVVMLLAYSLNIGRLTTPLNIVGALGLGYRYEQLVPQAKDHPTKSILKPLLISAVIIAPLLIAALAPQWLGLE